LGLNATNRAKNGYHPIENPKAPLNLNGKINVTRGIN
jgi:hypothetical protein